MAALVASCGTAKKTADAAPEGAAPVVESLKAVPDGARDVIKKPDVSLEKLAFSANLLKEAYVQAPKGNIILSPYSAGVAFSMLTDGARNRTRKGLITALSRSSYYGEFPYRDSVYTVKTANSVWLNAGLVAKDNYIGTLKNGYNAQVFSADAGDPFTAEAVNKWCGEHTEGLIDKLLDTLDPTNRMILMNALYFKAPWALPFSKERTFKEVFHGEEGDADVDFMHATTKGFRYGRLNGATLVNLPYKDGRYAMLIAVPDDMAAFFEDFSPATFDKALDALQQGEVALSLPKFKLEASKRLNEIMTALGAGEVFTPAADLSGISDEALFVNLAFQKCVLEVNEEGSEAAAVTVIMMTRATAVSLEPVPIRVDKPFLFAIYDTKTKEILFEGKIADI